MDGLVAVRQLLISDAALTALVPANRVIAGPAAIGSSLPLISLQSISKVDLNLNDPAAKRMVRERVQVTVHAANFSEQKAILRAVRHAVADQRPTVAGISNVTVHTESAGPDFMSEDEAIWLGSQDFMTIYNELR